MCTAVDVERAGTTNTFATVVVKTYRTAVVFATLVKSNRIDFFIYKLLVQNIHHLEERCVGANAVNFISLEMTFSLGVILTPYFKCKFHNLP